ncbi:hypothetical protein COLO4_02520 [Corchorus olitorius]|uniref:Uncharacterized protein n=1 Tax=Corchorus olitorius TaxID=93759 RepID=A0A1R3L0Y3_9ROSI|nr:hypothetical protein COLO4_02520 [Corchorus olitorius]
MDGKAMREYPAYALFGEVEYWRVKKMMKVRVRMLLATAIKSKKMSLPIMVNRMVKAAEEVILEWEEEDVILMKVMQMFSLAMVFPCVLA